MSQVISWQDQMCPILTAADAQARAIRAGPMPKIISSEASGEVPEQEAIACQGPSCGFFTPIVDAAGKVVNGRCAVAMIPQAISVVTNLLAHMGEPLSQAITDVQQ